MQRIKCVKEIFGEFSTDKSSLSVVHIDGDEGKAGLPFIIQPAASHDRLGGFFISEKIHDQKENISLPSVIGVQLHSDIEKDQQAQDLFPGSAAEVFQGAHAQKSQKQSEKYILLHIGPGVCEHEIPRDLRDQGKEKKIPPVSHPVPRVKEPFCEKEAEDGKRRPSDIPADTVGAVSSAADVKKRIKSRLPDT